MRQTLTREKLKTLLPCDDKYLDMFDEHESMNIEQAFDVGFTVNNICWLMGALGKRKEIIEFANFCAKQAENIVADADSATYWAARAAANAVYWAARVAAHQKANPAVSAAVRTADWAARTDTNADGTAIREEQKQFLMELLK